eukprot:1056165-Rhodomonas_salina.2
MEGRRMGEGTCANSAQTRVNSAQTLVHSAQTGAGAGHANEALARRHPHRALAAALRCSCRLLPRSPWLLPPRLLSLFSLSPPFPLVSARCRCSPSAPRAPTGSGLSRATQRATAKSDTRSRIPGTNCTEMMGSSSCVGSRGVRDDAACTLPRPKGVSQQFPSHK